MKKLSKFLLKSILWILSLIILIVLVTYFTASYWLVPLVNKYAPEVTKTETSLANADISLISGKVSFKGIKIGNPEGFAKGDLFKLDEVSVQFQPKTVLSDKIIVDKVLIKGTQILAELNTSGQVNLMVLNQNIQGYLNKGAVESKTATTTKTTATKAPAKQKSVIIKDLQILDSAVQVGFIGKKSTLKLPDFKEKNIGEKKNTSLKEGVMIIVNKLTTQPLEELQKSGKKALENTLDYLKTKTGENSKTFKMIEQSFSHLF